MGIGRLFKLAGGGAFGRDRRGNVAMMWGIMGAVLIGTIGIAVDFTRAQGIRNRMQNAVDGAALVAERSSNLSMAQREAAARAFFNSEMGADSGSVILAVTEMANGGHRVTANMPMPVTIARIVRNENWDIAVSAEAQADASPPIEVALVLDNTGSMQNDMQGLRDAAEDLTEYLLRLDGDSVSVALVPFVAQVNIGTGATQMGWMDTAGNAPFHGAFMENRELLRRPAYNNACTNASRFPTTVANAPLQSNGQPYQVRWVRSGTQCIAYNPSTINTFNIYTRVGATNGWGGCVEARPEPYDINDAAPVPGNPATMFVPYFATDEGDDDTADNNWLTEGTNLLNATNTTGIVNSANARTLSFFKYRSNSATNISYTQPQMRGPQRGCPRPIVPLTTDETVMVNAVRGMVHSFGGGTNQLEGLAWGWRVLSPTPPFTQGRDPASTPVRKVIVLMTDGENTSIDNDNNAFESDYSAYNHRRLWRDYQFNLLGFLGGVAAILPQWQRLGITDENAMINYINRREEDLCDAIKAAGIEIYTIQFRDTDVPNRNRLRDCSSDPHTGPGGHFYTAANAAQLQAAFNAIGSGIGQLRLTQ
jgi:Flp pilus assembly protein TadG